MKKKLLLFLMILVSLFMVVGCGKDDDDDDDEKSSKKVKEVKKEEEETKISSKAKVEEKVLVDRDGVKVTLKSIDYNSYEVVFKLLVENNTSKTVTVQDDNVSINGLMVNSLFSATVAPGKKANDELSIMNEDLKIAKIKAIKDVELDLKAFDDETYDDIFVEKGIKFETDATDYVQEYNTEGELVVDKNGVKIYALKVDDKDSFWGADIYFYIENNTGKQIVVQAEDVSINGFMVDDYFSTDLAPNKKAYDTMTFMEEDLKKNDIKSIDELELKFKVWDYASYDDILKTESIKVSFK